MAGKHVHHEEHRRGVILIAVIVGVLLSGVTVLTATRAAFSDATDNSSNYIDVGDVTLTDNDGGTNVLFEIDDMEPGESQANCIQVTYQGSIPNPNAVVVYSGGFVDSVNLAADINLTIEEGTGAPNFGVCGSFASEATIFSGTLSTFASTHTDYASGTGSWNPASTPESKAYLITVELDSNADDTSEGASITDLVFIWEVES